MSAKPNQTINQTSNQTKNLTSNQTRLQTKRQTKPDPKPTTKPNQEPNLKINQASNQEPNQTKLALWMNQDKIWCTCIVWSFPETKSNVLRLLLPFWGESRYISSEQVKFYLLGLELLSLLNLVFLVLSLSLLIEILKQ